MNRLEEKLSLLEESSSAIKVIMEPIDARTDQISKAGKVNKLISC